MPINQHSIRSPPERETFWPVRRLTGARARISATGTTATGISSSPVARPRRLDAGFFAWFALFANATCDHHRAYCSCSDATQAFGHGTGNLDGFQSLRRIASQPFDRHRSDGPGRRFRLCCTTRLSRRLGFRLVPLLIVNNRLRPVTELGSTFARQCGCVRPPSAESTIRLLRRPSVASTQ